mgnify:CR=1 FL=1
MHKSCIRCLLVATAITAGSLGLAAAPSALSSRAFGDDTKDKKEKKEDTGIDFKDDLGKKGRTPETKKKPAAKQDSTKTPAKPKRKEIDPDDEYYDLEGF